MFANTPYIGSFVCSTLQRVAPHCAPDGIRVVSGVCGLRVASTHLDKGSLALVLRPSSQGTQGSYRHSRDGRSLHRRVHPQPVVKAPRMRPVAKGSLDGIVTFYWFEEIVRGVLGFGLARVMDLETPCLE